MFNILKLFESNKKQNKIEATKPREDKIKTIKLGKDRINIYPCDVDITEEFDLLYKNQHESTLRSIPSLRSLYESLFPDFSLPVCVADASRQTHKNLFLYIILKNYKNVQHVSFLRNEKVYSAEQGCPIGKGKYIRVETYVTMDNLYLDDRRTVNSSDKHTLKFGDTSILVNIPQQEFIHVNVVKDIGTGYLGEIFGVSSFNKLPYSLTDFIGG